MVRLYVRILYPSPSVLPIFWSLEEEHEIMLPHVKAPILSKVVGCESRFACRISFGRSCMYLQVLEFCMAHNDSPLPEIKRVRVNSRFSNHTPYT